MHSLLLRQLKQIFGQEIAEEQLPDDLRGILEVVSSTYEDCDRERRFYNHVLEVNSQELNEKNASLERALQSLAAAQNLSRTGSWSYDILTQKIDWSDELYRIAKIEPGVGPPQLKFLTSLVLPEDVEKSDPDMQITLQEGQFDDSYRMVFPDGEVKYIHENRVVVYDKGGNPVLINGTMQDITPQRSAEEELRLLANVFHYSGEGILITDDEHKIIAVNQAFCHMSGYNRETVVGKFVGELSRHDDVGELVGAVVDEVCKKGSWRGELLGSRNDGSSYPQWVTVSAIYNEKNIITHYVTCVVDITERKIDQEKIFHLAHHDTLTGLVNRFSLEQSLSQSLRIASRQEELVVVMFLDLDRFKLINDTKGHAVGDKLLKEVAKRLTSSVRTCDIVSRIGGDEFVIVYTGIKDSMTIVPVARFLLHQLSLPYDIDGITLFSSPSIGISIYPDDGCIGEDLIKNADVAMYHAKENGRNNYQFFNDAMNVDANRRLKIESDLRKAIEERQFELYYQPLICTKTNTVRAVEALVRWNHPEQGVIAPDQFIPVAEESNLILPLGLWILEEACIQYCQWRKKFKRSVRVSVNLSAVQLQADGFVGQVRFLLNKYEIPDEEIVLEITESMAMTNIDEAATILNKVRDLGVRLAIDDFGTGYSSLAYLKQLPIATLKLDRTFVSDLEAMNGNDKICIATLALAHSLGLQVVAEGVETQYQRDFMINHGCDLLQGYYFSKPVPAERMTAYISNY